MNEAEDEVDWSLTTWEGSRRTELCRWCSLTIRERLQAIEEITEVARRIGAIGARKGSSGRQETLLAYPAAATMLDFPRDLRM